MISLVLLLLVLLPAAECLSPIISPKRTNPSLPDAGLVLLAGANLSSSDYVSLANTLSERSFEWGINLHVVLPDAAIQKFYDPFTLPGIVRKSVDSLKKYMVVNPRKNIFIAGHSMAGIVMKGLKDDYAGFLMYSAYLFVKELDNWNAPALQLSGERDGMLRFTKMAPIFEEFSELYAKADHLKWRLPVVILKELTHSSFCSVPTIRNFGLSPDMEPIVQIQEAQNRISDASLAFISANLDSTSNDYKQNGIKKLASLIDDTQILTFGYNKLKKYPVQELCSEGQSIVAGNVADGLITKVSVFDNIFQFMLSKPNFDKKSNTLTVTGMSFKDAVFPPGRDDKPHSPSILACKGESAESLSQKTGKLTESFGDCKIFNQRNIDMAFGLLTDEQKARYKASSKQLETADSLQKKSGIQWVSSNLEYTGSMVSAVEMRIPMSSRIYPGKHYCKVIHPARALEYMIIDSFY